MKKLSTVIFSFFVAIGLAAPVFATESESYEISWASLQQANSASPVEFKGRALFCHAYGPTARCVLASAPPAGMDCVVAVTPNKSHWVMVHTIPGGEAVQGDGKITGCGKVIPRDHWWWIR